MEDESILIDQELRTLQIIVFAMIISLLMYAGIAFFVVQGSTAEPTAVPAILPWVLTAVAVSILASTGTIVKIMMTRVRKVETASEKLAVYRSAVIAGTAMRESVGIIGLVATFITGNLLWVGVLSAVAALAILISLPTRSALRSAVQENAPIG